jgi:tetratricopeptide (TPR) repeat protein
MRPRLGLVLLLALASGAGGQDEDLPPDEVADLVDRYAARGTESLREGNYDEARLRYEKALRRDPAHRLAHLGIARCHVARGAYERADEALALLFRHHPADREGRVLGAEIDLRCGRVSDARAAMEQVLAQGGEGPDLVGLRARTVLAEALAASGQRAEARTVLDFFPDYYEGRVEALAEAAFQAETLRDDPAKAWPLSEELTLIARALRMYVELSPLDNTFAETAYRLLGYAQDLDPDNWESWVEAVRVTRLERYSAIARARKALQVAGKRNPELADLYVEVARSLLTGFGSAEARGLAETALRVNPNQADARAIVARVQLEDNEYGDADTNLQQGLAVNPRHRELLTLRATLQYLLGDEDAFAKGMEEVLRIDSSYGEGFHLAGLVVASRQRRYDRAVELVKRGLRIDPTNFQAHATIGVFLANLGRAAEARDALAKSKEMFPYDHPVRDNFRKVLDYVLGTMTEQRTEHFVVRYDPGEHEILHRFLPERLEADWADMVARYGFEPRAPILVEVFRNADDFSVRTLGLPGIPALGACFGGLITLDSPQALPPGQFLWASTARHEFAHVMSLQLSGGQVPRWFTEGLSVLEEEPLDTGWGANEDFEREVCDAWATGTLPPVGTFDAVFRSPRVAYAYYVGGLMLRFLRERSGEKGIVEALRLWGKDTPMRDVFQKAFGLGLEEFDGLFRDYVGARVKGYRITPNYNLVEARLRQRVLDDPADGEALLHLAWAAFQRRALVDAGAYLDQALKHGKPDRPEVLLLRAHLARAAGRAEETRKLLESYFAAGGEDFHACMLLASIHAQAGEDQGAVRYLEKARAAWPLQTGGQGPYALLRRYAQAAGDADKVLRLLEDEAKIASRDLPLRLGLAQEYEARKRPQDAVRALEEALRITLFDRRVHAMLLPLYRAAGEREKAVRAARCIVSLTTEEDADEAVASLWLDLAETLHEAGRDAEAKGAVEEARKRAADLPRLKEIEDKLGQ